MGYTAIMTPCLVRVLQSIDLVLVACSISVNIIFVIQLLLICNAQLNILKSTTFYCWKNKVVFNALIITIILLLCKVLIIEYCKKNIRCN